MGNNGGKWSGLFNFLKIFVVLFKLVLLSIWVLIKKIINFKTFFSKSEINNTEKETNSPEINKQEISYNNFGFPIYRDKRNK